MIFLFALALLAYGIYVAQLLLFSEPDVETSNTPNQFSVVIATNNYSEHTQKLIKSIPVSWEVIVIQNGLLLEEVEAESSNVQFFRLSEANKKRALQFGVENASNDFVLQLDDDVFVQDHFFKTLQKLQLRDDTVYQLPVHTTHHPKSWGMFQVEDRMLLAHTMLSKPNRQILAYGAGLIYPKNLFLALKPFEGNEHILSGDDMFLVHKAKKEARVQSLLEPILVIETSAKKSFNEFWKQRLRWASKNTHFSAARFHLVLFLQVFLGVLLPFVGISKIVGGGELVWVYPVLYAFKSAFDILLCRKIKHVLDLSESISLGATFQTMVLYPFFSLAIGSIGWVKSLKKHVN